MANEIPYVAEDGLKGAVTAVKAYVDTTVNGIASDTGSNGSKSKTVTKLVQEKGKVTATFETINIDASQVTGGAIPVEHGGTGATTAEAARNNLNVYSKDEVDTLRKNSYKVVTALPATGEEGVIYLYLEDASKSDAYSEYIWSDGQWVKFGEASIDLSEYVKEMAVSGSGNAVTGYSKVGNKLTLAKDATFATATELTAEANARKNADTALQGDIGAEVTRAKVAEKEAKDAADAAQETADSALTKIATETSERKAADTALQTAIDGKANATHTHEIADVNGLQTALDGKQATGDYATVTELNDGLAKKMDLQKSVGSSTTPIYLDSTGKAVAVDTASMSVGQAQSAAGYIRIGSNANNSNWTKFIDIPRAAGSNNHWEVMFRIEANNSEPGGTTSAHYSTRRDATVIVNGDATSSDAGTIRIMSDARWALERLSYSKDGVNVGVYLQKRTYAYYDVRVIHAVQYGGQTTLPFSLVDSEVSDYEDTATKTVAKYQGNAIYDGDGYVITSTYATKTALTEGLAGKSDTGHTHAIANVSGLQDALDGKQAKIGTVGNDSTPVFFSNGEATAVDTSKMGVGKASKLAKMATSDGSNVAYQNQYVHVGYFTSDFGSPLQVECALSNGALGNLSNFARFIVRVGPKSGASASAIWVLCKTTSIDIRFSQEENKTHLYVRKGEYSHFLFYLEKESFSESKYTWTNDLRAIDKDEWDTLSQSVYCPLDIWSRYDGSGNVIADTYATKTALTEGLAGKSDTGHTHTIANVSGLQSALDGKQAAGSYATTTQLSDETTARTNADTALDGRVKAVEAAKHSHGNKDTLDAITAAFTSELKATYDGKQDAMVEITYSEGYDIANEILGVE